MVRSVGSVHLMWRGGPGSRAPRPTCTRCDSVPCTSMTRRATTLTGTPSLSRSTEPSTSG
eukprot:10330543-Lingulodinium_polyedra.AAC.1